MNESQLKQVLRELGQDFEVIQGIKQDLPLGSMSELVMNLQTYETLKTRYLKALNEAHINALQVFTKAKYNELQKIIAHIKKEL